MRARYPYVSVELFRFTDIASIIRLFTKILARMKSNIKWFALIALAFVAGFLVNPNSSPVVASTLAPPAPQGPCIPYQQDSLDFIPVEQYLKDIQRFQWEIGEHTTKQLQNINMRFYDTKQASRQCTFSLHRLKNFIALIEQKAAEHKIKPELLGITWNYAIYDNTTAHYSEKRGDYRSLMTLYGVPSMFTEKGSQLVDINDFDLLGPKLASGATGGGNKSIAIVGLESDESAFNFGYMCPPTCDIGQETLFEYASEKKSTYESN